MRSRAVRKRCIAVPEFGDLANRTANDPGRAHIEACARCRAAYLNYLSFMDADPGDVPFAPARAALAAVIARESRNVTAASPKVVAERPSLARFFRSWRFRGLVLAPAACAAILVTYVAIRTQESAKEPVLRSMSQAAAIRLEEGAIGPDGSIRLTWDPVPNATGYQVALYAGSLRPIYQSGVHAGTVLAIPAGVLTPADMKESAILWRVTAMKGPEVVARSPVGKLRTR